MRPDGGGLATPVSIANGGTNSITAAAALISLGAAANGINTDITSLTADELIGTNLTIGDAVGNIGFFGSFPNPQSTIAPAGLAAQPAAYNQGDINFALDYLVDEINNLVGELQLLGLVA